MGKSRSATVVCAYLMYKFGVSPSEALEQLCEGRPVCEPNPGFQEQLQVYERMLKVGEGEEREKVYAKWLETRYTGTWYNGEFILLNIVAVPVCSCSCSCCEWAVVAVASTEPISIAIALPVAYLSKGDHHIGSPAASHSLVVPSNSPLHHRRSITIPALVTILAPSFTVAASESSIHTSNTNLLPQTCGNKPGSYDPMSVRRPIASVHVHMAIRYQQRK